MYACSSQSTSLQRNRLTQTCTRTCVQYMPCFGNCNDGIMQFTNRLCEGLKK